MVINYCGEKCFKIQSGQLSLVVDPLPRFKGDVALITSPWKAAAEEQWPPVAGQIYGPGEYEVKEIEVNGWPIGGGNTAYLAVIEEIRLCFLGDGGKDPKPEMLEKFGDIDILFAPAEITAKSVKQLNPKIVIPFYKKPDALKSFLKEMDQKTETQDKFVTKKKDLTTGTKVVVLKI